MTNGTNNEKKTKYQSLNGLIAEIYQARTRSQKWNFLHSTEYKGETPLLNKVLAAMTDKDVEEWFPKIATEYIAKQVGIL